MTDIPLISISSERMNTDPVHYLLEQRAIHGDLFYLKQGLVFCRDDRCVGSVAVLSVTGVRFILENYGIFRSLILLLFFPLGTPMSVINYLTR